MEVSSLTRRHRPIHICVRGCQQAKEKGKQVEVVWFAALSSKPVQREQGRRIEQEGRFFSDETDLVTAGDQVTDQLATMSTKRNVIGVRMRERRGLENLKRDGLPAEHMAERQLGSHPANLAAQADQRGIAHAPGGGGQRTAGKSNATFDQAGGTGETDQVGGGEHGCAVGMGTRSQTGHKRPCRYSFLNCRQ
jgi:hypothetical protein